MEKLKKFWKNLKLRLSLLRIWFMKNILLFLRVAVVVCLICIFTGVITADTPVLGTIIYPIFAPLADEINAIIAEKEIDGLMTFFSVAISVLFTLSMFFLKAKNIAQSDIKNPKLKYALVQANMYFNEDGKLVKKVEKATGQDIDFDGKIDEKEVVDKSNNKGFFKSIVSAVQEFNTIMKADLSTVEDEDDEDYDFLLKTAELADAEEATKEIDELIKGGTTNAIADSCIGIADEKIEETSGNENLTQEEKENKLSLLGKLKNFFKGLKKKPKEEVAEKDDAEVVADNMNDDAEIKEEKKEEKIEVVKEEKPVETKVEEKAPVTNKEKQAQDFLNSLRNRK